MIIVLILVKYKEGKNIVKLFIIYILRFSHSFPHEKFRLENCDSQSQQRNGFLTRA